MSRKGQGSRAVPGGSRALRSIADVVLECSSSHEDEVSLARRGEPRGLSGGVVATSGSLVCTPISGMPPDAKRPSRVSPCQRSVLPGPMPKLVSCLNVTVSQSLQKFAREVACVQGEPAGNEEDSETSDEIAQ